jgi:hypothetical protein
MHGWIIHPLRLCLLYLQSFNKRTENSYLSPAVVDHGKMWITQFFNIVESETNLKSMLSGGNLC